MSTTITLWLLISIGSSHPYGFSSSVVERFKTQSECMKVANAVYAESTKRKTLYSPALMCVQAEVVK